MAFSRVNTLQLHLYHIFKKCHSSLQNNAVGVHPVLVSDTSFTGGALSNDNKPAAGIRVGGLPVWAP